MLLWLLTTVMMIAIGIMAIFQVRPSLPSQTESSDSHYSQIWLILLGESAVESHDNGRFPLSLLLLRLLTPSL